MGGRSEEELVRLARSVYLDPLRVYPSALMSSSQAASQRRQASAHKRQCSCISACSSHSWAQARHASRQPATSYGPRLCSAGETSQDPTSCQANIGTILVCADARHQVTSHRFTETSISARRAGLGTFKTRCNTRRELLLIDSEISLGMSLKHGPHVRHDVPLVAVGRLPRTSAGTAPVDMRLLLLPAFLNPRRSCK